MPIMIKHFKNTQSNKFVIFSQYLKKEVRNWVHFLHADKHLQVGIIVFDEVARHVQSTQNINLVIFLQYPKKKLLQLLLCSIVMKNTYFRGV